jgi:hypothetical protein
MLYRLSYSLTGYPNDAPRPGNILEEDVGMRWIRSIAVIVGLAAAAADTTVWAAPPAAPAGAQPAVPVAQATDGTILLHGSKATIHGTTLRWEPQEKKQTLGFWTKAEDAASWTFAVRTPGTFDVEVLQGCGAGQGGSEMRITLDPGGDRATTLPFVVEDTGGFQEFRPRTIGRLTIAEAGDHVLRVKPERIAKKAACDIRQIRLLPVK